MNKPSVTIPTELISELEAWGKLTARLFGRLRREAGLAPKGVPQDQAWFWLNQWQGMECEADEAVANANYDEFNNVDAAIKHLHEQV